MGANTFERGGGIEGVQSQGPPKGCNWIDDWSFQAIYLITWISYGHIGVILVNMCSINILNIILLY
jgi:hypothetical protein